MDYVSPLKEMYAELGAMMEKAERRPGWIEIKPETSKLMNKIYDLQNEKVRRNEPLYTIEPGYLENCGEFIIAEKQDENAICRGGDPRGEIFHFIESLSTQKPQETKAKEADETETNETNEAEETQEKAG